MSSDEPVQVKESLPMTAHSIIQGLAAGRVVASLEALSFWGGVDPATGNVIDVHHPLHGESLTGSVLLMPTSRGSCTGSGVLLDLILSGKGPAALIFSEAEDVLTLGALIATEMFNRPMPVVRVSADEFQVISTKQHVVIDERSINAEGVAIDLVLPGGDDIVLTETDRSILSGARGEAAAQAMKIICTMARQQGAGSLIDVCQAHIDGCIYASPANLLFAEKMAGMGARVSVPTTMNAISVDRSNWKTQGIPASFGTPAAKLADAYVQMGCQPTFTCSPYLLSTAPRRGEAIAWAESNAVIYANSVLGARTAKHPDFLDLCIALTGRAPNSGVYLAENRRAGRVIEVDIPENVDDSFWPLIGYLAGKASPDKIPVLRGLSGARPSGDDLKALCAAFGTTSAAPLIHIEGVTPEGNEHPIDGADSARITRHDLVDAWMTLNDGPEEVELVAIGSPHASLSECKNLADVLADRLGGKPRRQDVSVIVTAGKDVIARAKIDGTLARLKEAGVLILPDLCWCSISEPLFPSRTRAVMTNSGKYAHYGPGLSGRPVRFGNLASCVDAAVTGRASKELPRWLADSPPGAAVV